MNNEHAFAVGEVAIYWLPSSPNHGREVTIIGPMESGRYLNAATGGIEECAVYPVDVSNLDVPRFIRLCGAHCTPDMLRKLPPHFGSSSWSEGIWKPRSVSV